jgi:hypothetical protein
MRVMGSSMQARRGEVAAEQTSPALPLIGMVRGSTAKDTSAAERGRWVLPVAVQAIDRVMARKEAAILMGVSESKLSDLLKGVDDKSVSLLKLGALGDAFWIALIDELRAYYKLDDPQERVRQAMELVQRGITLLVTEAQKR